MPRLQGWSFAADLPVAGHRVTAGVVVCCRLTSSGSWGGFRGGSLQQTYL